jgi:Tol biopolymer transport system component
MKQFVRFWLLLCCGLTAAACSSSDNTFKCGDLAPQLTADGREVIYNRAICETPAGCWLDCHSRLVDSHLQVYDVETQAIARLPFGTSAFDVSSDGKVIAYPSGSLLEIYDRESGNTTSVDVTEFGSFWGPPPSPSISGDGQVVAFTLLVKGDDPWDSAIFLYDRATEQIRRATTQPRSEGPSLSNDGRFLAYQTRPDPTPDVWEPPNAIHILDLASGQSTLVSVNSEGEPGNGRSFEPFISGDGRFVVFRSSATDLLAPSTSPPRIEGAEVYLHDRETGALSLLSTAADSAEPSGTSNWVIGSLSRSHAISTDAQFVVYQSDADNIVPVEGQASVPIDNVYRQDVETDRTTRVSINSLGQPANGFMTYPSVSDDGHFIAFQTTSTNLDPDDLDEGDVYLHDIRSGETTWVNRD